MSETAPSSLPEYMVSAVERGETFHLDRRQLEGLTDGQQKVELLKLVRARLSPYQREVLANNIASLRDLHRGQVHRSTDSVKELEESLKDDERTLHRIADELDQKGESTTHEEIVGAVRDRMGMLKKGGAFGWFGVMFGFILGSIRVSHEGTLGWRETHTILTRIGIEVVPESSHKDADAVPGLHDDYEWAKDFRPTGYSYADFLAEAATHIKQETRRTAFTLDEFKKMAHEMVRTWRNHNQAA